MTLSFAAAQPKVLAAVPYYGPTPQPPSVMAATEAAILAQYGETDARVNAGIPDLEQAMAGKTLETEHLPGRRARVQQRHRWRVQRGRRDRSVDRAPSAGSRSTSPDAGRARADCPHGRRIRWGDRSELAGVDRVVATGARRHPRTRRTSCSIVLDDVGYAQLGCYGSDIATPNIDRLAADGVRFANFHTTALCSPTRSCLLTGRNHHSNGMARVADLALGFPGLQRSHPPPQRVPAPRSSRPTGTRRSRSGSGT